MSNQEDTTKISISKDLHKIVKKICDDCGLKMQFFEDKAIKEYIANNYPVYIDTQTK
jgi:hypothetical protein